jgi:transcriptional regulator GlxA family with amidase domain
MNYCFRTGSVPRVDEMATMLSMSREGLTRAFRAATGQPPAEAFRCMQIRRAQHLLGSTEMATAEIARAAAFGSDRAFFRAFLRCTGVTPTDYRRTVRHRSSSTTQPSPES